MRSWQIIVVSAAAATIVIVGLALSGLVGAPAPGRLPALTPALIASAAIAWLAVYGVCAAVLATIAVRQDLDTARQEIGRAAAPSTMPHAALASAIPALFPALRARAARGAHEIEPDPALSIPADRIIPPARLRDAGARLYFSRLAGAQHPTALVLLLIGAAVLALAPRLDPGSGGAAAIGAAPLAARVLAALSLARLAAAAAALLLIIAAALGRLALARPIAALQRGFARLRVGNVHTRLLREVLDTLRLLPQTLPAAAPPPSPPAIDSGRIEAQIAAAQRDSRNAIGALTAAVDGLGRFLRGHADEVRSAFAAAEPALAPPEAYAGITADLRSAVAALADAVTRIEAAPAPAPPEPAAAAPPQTPQTRLSTELQALLREIDDPIPGPIPGPVQ